jgi:N-acetyl-anhydromuramyl-L-alanine amidase AmpD
MKIDTSKQSPNVTDQPIPVEFVVLHYTALSLEATLDRFLDPRAEVSAHLVIGQAGEVYELVPCMAGTALRAWHAGRSRLSVTDAAGQERVVEEFNDRSIGIELVNLNGNLFEYTEAQYVTLFELLRQLKGIYPALAQPDAIVGHEQIAGFRGKADPGRCFAWHRLFAECYPGLPVPVRSPRCPEVVAERVKQFCLQCQSPAAPPASPQPAGNEGDGGAKPLPQRLPARFFEGLSTLLEAVLSAEEV